MPEVLEVVRDWLARPWVVLVLGVVGLLLAARVLLFVVRRVLVRLLARGIRATRFAWDDALLERHVLDRAAWLAPLLLVYYALPFFALEPFELVGLVALLQRLTLAGIVLVGFLTVSAVLNSVGDVYTTLPMARERPIKGYLQIVKIFIAVLVVVWIIALLLGRSPVALLTGIGALTAVLLLIFRDTILSFVASLQLASNDMVRIGDWIEMPKYGADGDVIDIALHTVKVQNWDKTITTIPTYKLIEDSFKNWRGMQQSGGRRIKRALHLDMSSVRFLTAEDMDRFSKFVLLTDYVERKRQELDLHNREQVPAGSDLVANARRLTNLGTFRAYVHAYLRQHPKIHTEGMTFLVRQLQPGPEGLPLEIYVFSKETAWVVYEGIQADVFDHLLAILPEFGLRVFQQPTGHDLSGWAQAPEAPARPPQPAH